MRIIAGAQRGLQLADVGKGDPGAQLRPTSDRVRESLFNVLTGGRMGDPLRGKRVLDLFAGTGALALEALSRGAAHATLVEQGRVGQGLIRDNIKRARREKDAQLLTHDATRLPPHGGAGFDLVFMDPPYGRGMGQTALAAAVAGGWLASEAYVVWEEATPQIAPAGFALVDQRKYGDTHVTFLQRIATA